MKLKILSLAAQVVFLGSFSVAKEINTIITDQSGQPIGGVNVRVLTAGGPEMTTDLTGKISFGYSGKPVLIEHPNYAPMFVFFTLEPREPPVIILKRRAAEEWTIPRCRNVKGKRQLDGAGLVNLRLAVPRRFSLFTSRDSDYLLVRIVDQKSKSELRHWKRTVSAGVPGSVWFKNVTHLATRPLNLAGTQGYDVRGTSENGRMSRWVGVFYTFVEYTAVNPPLARELDKAIDKLCYE